MHIMALDGFFKTQFSQADGTKFGSLRTLVENGGGLTFQTLFMLGITSVLIALVIAGGGLSLASKSKGYDETKKRLTRVVIILIFMTALVGLVGKIALLFAL